MDNKLFDIPKEYIDKVRNVVMLLINDFSESKTLNDFRNNYASYNIDWERDLDDKLLYSYKNLPENVNDMKNNNKILDTSLMRYDDNLKSLERMKENINKYKTDIKLEIDELLDKLEYKTASITDNEELKTYSIDNLLKMYFEMYRKNNNQIGGNVDNKKAMRELLRVSNIKNNIIKKYKKQEEDLIKKVKYLEQKKKESENNNNNNTNNVKIVISTNTKDIKNCNTVVSFSSNKQNLLSNGNIGEILNKVLPDGKKQIQKNINMFSKSIKKGEIYEYPLGIFGSLYELGGNYIDNMLTKSEIRNYIDNNPKTSSESDQTREKLVTTLFKIGNILFRLPMNPRTDLLLDNVWNNLDEQTKEEIGYNGMGYIIDNMKFINDEENSEYGLLVQKNKDVTLPRLGTEISNNNYRYVPIMGVSNLTNAFVEMLKNIIIEGNNEDAIDVKYLYKLNKIDTQLKGYLLRNLDYNYCLIEDMNVFNKLNDGKRVEGEIYLGSNTSQYGGDTTQYESNIISELKNKFNFKKIKGNVNDNDFAFIAANSNKEVIALIKIDKENKQIIDNDNYLTDGEQSSDNEILNIMNEISGYLFENDLYYIFTTRKDILDKWNKSKTIGDIQTVFQLTGSDFDQNKVMWYGEFKGLNDNDYNLGQDTYILRNNNCRTLYIFHNGDSNQFSNYRLKAQKKIGNIPKTNIISIDFENNKYEHNGTQEDIISGGSEYTSENFYKYILTENNKYKEINFKILIVLAHGQYQNQKFNFGETRIETASNLNNNLISDIYSNYFVIMATCYSNNYVDTVTNYENDNISGLSLPVTTPIAGGSNFASLYNSLEFIETYKTNEYSKLEEALNYLQGNQLILKKDSSVDSDCAISEIFKAFINLNPNIYSYQKQKLIRDIDFSQICNKINEDYFSKPKLEYDNIKSVIESVITESIANYNKEYYLDQFQQFFNYNNEFGINNSKLYVNDKIKTLETKEVFCISSIETPPEEQVQKSTTSSPQVLPGQPVPGQPVPGQPVPGQPVPGQPAPGQPVPGQPVPGQPAPPSAPYAPPSSPPLPEPDDQLTEVEKRVKINNLLNDVLVSLKSQWSTLYENFNEKTIQMICIEIIIRVVNNRIDDYKQLIRNNISKHLNDTQIYTKIVPYTRNDVVIKNVYKIEIEPMYYNTYSMIRDVVRVSFKKCYDVLSKIIMKKRMIENNIKSRVTDRDINIDFLSGLDVMRKESLEIRRINKIYNKEKNTFTIKIRVILYELTNILYKLINISNMGNHVTTEKTDYSPGLKQIIEVIFERKYNKETIIDQIKKNILWKVNMNDTANTYDLNNQINNLKWLYMLKSIYSLAAIKIFIVKNLVNITGKDMIKNSEINNMLGFSKKQIKYLKLEDTSYKGLKKISKQLKKYRKKKSMHEIEQIKMLENKLKYAEEYKNEIIDFLGYNSSVLSALPSENQWKKFHYISAMTRGDFNSITSLGEFDMSTVNSLSGLWVYVRVPSLTALRGGSIENSLSNIRDNIKDMFDGKGRSLSSQYVLVNILPTMLSRGNKLYVNDMYYISHANEKLQKKEFHFLNPEKFMKIKTNDNGTNYCNIKLGCRYNNVLSYIPEMRRCKIINSTINNMSGYLYKFTDTSDIKAINLEYLVNNWHIVIRRILCGTLGTKKLDKIFNKNYLYKMNSQRRNVMNQKYNVYDEKTGTGNIRLINNKDWNKKMSLWLFSGTNINV